MLGIELGDSENNSIKLVISRVHGNIKSTFSSCNTGTSGLPDMYTQSLRATGPRMEL